MTTLTRPADNPPPPATPPREYETWRVFYEAGRADALAELEAAP